MVNNILVLCHGMTIKDEPFRHDDDYNAILNGLWDLHPGLKDRFSCILPIEYGHEMPRGTDEPLRPDEKITRAQKFVQERISYEKISAQPSPEDELLPPISEFNSLLLRTITNPIRDTVFALGLTDALYYASSDGEREIRNVVYGQILKALDACDAQSEVRLHIIAHSLGATVMFDFLYGLFRKDKTSREILETKTMTARYAHWRNLAVGLNPDGRLKLGSLVTLGGQIPFFFFRKQALVERFAAQQCLDPENIGVPKEGLPIWKIFYDVDDVLGYPVRGLFEAKGSIRQFQLNTGAFPHLAHDRYWRDPTVLEEVGSLLTRTSAPKKLVDL